MGTTSRILDGYTVVDLSTFVTGGFATAMLANQGADVIKVEYPEEGDDSRHAGPPFVDVPESDGPGTVADERGESPYFWSVNHGKQSIELDLKTDHGLAALYDLVAEADVFVENFRPGTADRLGVGYETLRDVNDGIVYCSISGFGETGPWRDRPGYDQIVQGTSGVMSVTGPESGDPVKVGLPITDLVTAMWAAFGMLGALFRRERTGQGDRVEIGMHDAVLPLLTKQAGKAFAGEDTRPMGTKDPVLAPYQAYPTEDGHLNVACANQKLWRGLCDAIDRPELADDPRFETNADRVEHMDELEAELSGVFRQRTTDEWVEQLAEEAGLPVGPVYDIKDALHNEQTEARGMVTSVDHPAAGQIDVVEHPLNFAAAASGFDAAPPLLGEDTEAVLRRLGYDEASIEEMREAGAIPDC